MRGFVSILEAFLAIALIYIVLGQIQLNMPARYSDSSSMEKLSRYSHDIAFSLCGNMKVKRSLLTDMMSFDLNGVIPYDICYKVSVFENSSNNHLLNSLVYNYTTDYNTSQNESTSNQTANNSWFETNISDEPSDIYALAAGDANNDGKNEVVVGLNGGVSRIRMYENKSGGWVETNISTKQEGVRSLAIGDANNDGQNDVAAGLSFNSKDVRIYENKSGGWIETNISDISYMAVSVAIGDANNDGQNEVVVGKFNNTPNDYNLRMYENVSGGWVETNISDTPVYVDSVAIGDANNDGKNEVVIGLSTATNEVRIYENKTGKWVETNISDAPYTVQTIAIGDANNDGKNDVVIGMGYSGATTKLLRMYENKSGGWVETNISDEPTHVSSVAIGDANNDGNKDVVIGLSTATNEVRIYENKTGKWVETNISDAPIYVSSVAIGDANNDGKNEMVIGMLSTNNEARMYSYSPVCSQGTLNSSTSLIETNISDEPAGVYSVAIGDANNDGSKEIIMGMQNWPYPVRMYENKSGQWVKTNISDPGNTYVWSVAIGDANNDGKNDIVVGMDAAPKAVRMYENKTGGWVETNISSDFSDVQSVAVGDANNDGKNEVVVGMESTTNEVRMYTNTSGGWVETNISDEPNGGVYSVAIGDANNDGQKEAVIGGYFDNGTRIYQNIRGGWIETNISDLEGGVNAVAIGDANNDGKNDIVSGTYWSEPYHIILAENKSGTWVTSNISNIVSEGIQSIAIGDVNNDGKNEVIVGLYSSADELRMYENKTGGWVETNISDLPTTVRSVAVGDANRDGQNEIVVGMDTATNELRMYSYTTSTWCTITGNVTYQPCNITSTTPSATSSCLIAGGPNSTNYSAYDCRTSCLGSIISSNDARVNLLSTQNFTVAFSPGRNGTIVEFFLEGSHNQSGTTSLYDSVGNQVAAYNFAVGADEGHTFDLSDFFPDPNGVYNITVKPSVNASYDYAYLNVSTNTYSPKMIVVQTWNYGN
jgi:hypothetical protein